MRARFLILALLCGILRPAMAAQDAPLASALAGAPTNKYVPGRVLVRFRSGRSSAARTAAHLAAGAALTTQVRHVPDLEVVDLGNRATVRQALASYRRNPDVLYAEPDYIVHAEVASPNDPFFTFLWGLSNTGQQNGVIGADIKALQAWDLSTGSSNVAVGILDTGIIATHPDLADNVLAGAFFVDGEITDFIGHGTHVAGTIGASGNNGTGVAGVNWHVSMEPCKFINFDGGSTSNAIACLDFIAGLKDQGMNIIATNNSWGGTEFSFSLQDAIRAQMDRGILFIAAAGNEGEDNDVHPHFPASYDLPNIISVAATDRADRMATFSNFGRHSVHLGAPGVSVVSTIGLDGYASLSGTSMATPHVTGVAALMKAYKPGLDWRAIKNRILAAGDPATDLSFTATGKRLNAFAAMTCLGKTAVARMQPRNDVVTTVAGAHVKLEMLNVNCDQPAGNMNVTVQPGAQNITLLDDGVGPDQAAGDGLYTEDFIAPDSGTFTLNFPNGDQVQVKVLQAYSFQQVPFAPRIITGTSLALSDDQSRAIDLPFPIHFGGNTFQRLFVNSNGYVTLDYGYNSAAQLPIPFPTTGSIIAPWWEDWAPKFDAAENVYWAVNGTAPSREIVIEWRKLLHFVMVGPDPNGVTFQMVLFEDRDDVLFSYLDVDISNTFIDIPGGGSGSVGIQVGPTAGTQFSFVPFFFGPDPAPLKNSMTLLWQLAPVDFSLKVDPAVQKAFVGSASTFPVVLKSLRGFTGNVNISCTGAAPATCTGGTVSPSPFGTLLNLQVNDPVSGAYTFNIHGESAASQIVHEQQVTLNLVDLQIGAPTPTQLSIPNGGSKTLSFPVTAAGPFNSTVTLSCAPLPGITCSFSPGPQISPTVATPVNVTMTVAVAPKSTPGSYNLQIFGQTEGASRTKNVPVTITANSDFFLVAAATEIGAEMAQPNLVGLTVDAQDGYAGTVQLSCSVVPAGPSCAVSTSAVAAFPAQLNVNIAAGSAANGVYQITLTGNDGTRSHSITLNYRLGGYTITATGPLSTFSGVGDTRVFSITWTGTPNAQLSGECFAPLPASCFVSSAPISTATSPIPAQVLVTLFINTNGQLPSFPVTFVLLENGLPVRSLTQNFTAQGFTLVTGPTMVQTVVVGQVSGPFDLTLVPWGGYNLPTDVLICGFTCFTKTVTPGGNQPLAVPFSLAPPINSRFNFGDSIFNVRASALTPVGQIQVATTDNYTLHVQDVWLTASRESIALSPGKSTSITVTAHNSNGLAVPLALSCPANLGTGVSCSFDKTTLLPGESAQVTISTTSATPPSFRQIEITGSTTIVGQAATRKALLRLDVGNYTFDLRTTELTVPNGGEAFFIVDGNVSFGTSEIFPVSVSCDSADPGVTCEVPLTTVVPGAFGVPVRTTAGVTATGPHIVHITVSVEGETHVIPATVIMQGADSIILTSPNGEENWPGGPHPIEWQYAGNPGSAVRLELLKNGALDRVIADNVPLGAGGRGSFNWIIPSDSRFSQFAKVRIVSTTLPDISDTSDIRFWTGHGAELISPVGGQIVNLNDGGFNAFYTWTGLGAGSFELYKSGVLLKTFPSGGNGYFDSPIFTWAEFIFPLPDVPEGNDYTLRIIPGTDVSRASFNPGGAFSLVRPSVTITSPAAGQVFQPGQQVRIEWTSHSIPTSDVQLMAGDPNAPFDPNRTFSLGTVPIGTNGAGSFTWTIPANAAPSRNYLIGFQVLGPLQFGVASPVFTIGSFNKLSIGVTGLGRVVSTNPNLPVTIVCVEGPVCDNFLVTGTTVTLHAFPEPNFRFSGWGGACTGVADCTITLNADTTLTAGFVSTLPDISFIVPDASATVQSGSPATYAFSVAGVNNLTGQAQFSCSTLPVNARCTFSPATVTLGATPANVTLTISTNGASGTSAVVALGRTPSRPRPISLDLLALGLLLVPGVVLAARKRRLVRAACAAVVLLTLLSCGGGGGGSAPPPPPPNNNTPAGTYAINVNAAVQQPPITRTSQVTLVVK
jgi:hypothetical protein